MGTEIERKFIVPRHEHYRFLNLPIDHNRLEILQAYLSSEGNQTIRLRIQKKTFPSLNKIVSSESAWLTIKGPSSDDGLTRSEWEESFPLYVAKDIIETLKPPMLNKVRHFVQDGKNPWDVDILKVSNLPGHPPEFYDYLVIAEYEYTDPERVKNVELPSWVGKEVTGDHRFSMSNLTTELKRILAWQEAYDLLTI